MDKKNIPQFSVLPEHIGIIMDGKEDGQNKEICQDIKVILRVQKHFVKSVSLLLMWELSA